MKLTVGIAPWTLLAELCPAPARGSNGPLDPQQITISRPLTRNPGSAHGHNQESDDVISDEVEAEDYAPAHGIIILTSTVRMRQTPRDLSGAGLFYMGTLQDIF
ncbi:hypothetical protein DPMN_046199 [Dreissena polymorpha]|uniref:Secreted protein n=1 Tax=Dreissena polymorpha TaxID=45954 RepID=A0A9D4D6E4_DREPO|nr:hypothetical protein DPMN_046199 [Dreissena polymorpha]